MVALIMVTAAAYLPVAMAHVALPSVGAAFHASQTQLSLVVAGLACALLWLWPRRRQYGIQIEVARAAATTGQA